LHKKGISENPKVCHQFNSRGRYLWGNQTSRVEGFQHFPTNNKADWQSFRGFGHFATKKADRRELSWNVQVNTFVTFLALTTGTLVRLHGRVNLVHAWEKSFFR